MWQKNGEEKKRIVCGSTFQKSNHYSSGKEPIMNIVFQQIVQTHTIIVFCDKTFSQMFQHYDEQIEHWCIMYYDVFLNNKRLVLI